MRKTNINAQITNITENELAVLNAIFGERITIEEVKKSGRKSAPKQPEDHKKAEASKAPKNEASKAPKNEAKVKAEAGKAQKNESKKVAPAKNATETEEKPKTETWAEKKKAWKIEKYGSEEAADAVQDFANEVAAEWRAKKRETGKNVVGHSEYKTKLYEEAYKRYLASQKKGA